MKVIGGIFGAIAVILITPFIILNFLAGIIGGIWLLILGEWSLVFFSIIASIILPMIFGIVLLPTLPLAYLMDLFYRKKRIFLMNIFAWINLSFVQIVMIIWTHIVFISMLILSEEVNIIPYFLMGYAVATGPIAYMAKQEGPDATGSYAGVLLVQVSYIIFVVFYFLNILPYALPIIFLLALLMAGFLMGVANIQIKR